MATPNQETELRYLAEALEGLLTQIYGEKMAFFLCVSRFGSGEGVADYIGNAERGSSIQMMRETVNRLTAKQDVQATQGNA